jgi:uncharacterized membrane protein YedE/YeeE
VIRSRLLIAKNLLGQARYVLGGVIFGFLIWLLCLWLADPGKDLRLTGTVLQLAGIVSVVWGLVTLFPLFGRPPVAHSIMQWFYAWRYVFVEMPPVSGQGAMVEGADEVRGYRVWRSLAARLA